MKNENQELTNTDSNSATVAGYKAPAEAYDSTTDTLLHIKRVQELMMWFANYLLNSALQHDWRNRRNQPLIKLHSFLEIQLMVLIDTKK